MTPHEQPREPKGLTTGGQWSRKPQPTPMQGSSVGSGMMRDRPTPGSIPQRDSILRGTVLDEASDLIIDSALYDSAIDVANDALDEGASVEEASDIAFERILATNIVNETVGQRLKDHGLHLSERDEDRLIEDVVVRIYENIFAGFT